MTLDELRDAESKGLPVVIFNRDNPASQLMRQIGIISSISDEWSEHATHKEPSCWITLQDGIRVFVWSHEIRIARLRNPFKINAVFQHTTSNKYSGDDRNAV